VVYIGKSIPFSIGESSPCFPPLEVEILVPYAKITNDVLTKLPEKVNEQNILVSFNSVYSDIPYKRGEKTLNYLFNKHRDKFHRRFSNQFIIDGIKFILKTIHIDNIYHDKFVHTIKGH